MSNKHNNKKVKTESSLTNKKINEPVIRKSRFSFEIISITIFTTLAFFLRVYNINVQSFWVDEYLHVIPALDFVNGYGLNHIDGNNGVFTTWVEVVFLSLFGNTEFAARLPMALFSAFTIPVLFVLVKKLTNRDIALLTVLLFSVSLFSIFWGRVVRNYATFLPFFLLLHYYFIKIFEPENNLLRRNVNFKPILMVLFLLFLILSLLNHPLTIFFFFTLLFFGTSLWVFTLFKETGRQRILNKYLIFPPFLVLVSLIWHPSFGKFVVGVLKLFLPQNIVDFQTPNINNLIFLFNSNRFEAFDVYKNVLKTDMYLMPLLGTLGFILAIIKFKKFGVYITIQFLVTLLLMSFVFRDAALVRYLYFIYPFVLTAIAISIWWIVSFIIKKRSELNDKNFKPTILFIAFIICVLIAKPSETKNFLNNKNHGLLIDRNLSEWYFTNWKDPYMYIQSNMTNEDVVISSVPNSSKVYLGIDTSRLGWFRQTRYDGLLKKYVPNEPSGKPVSGYTTEEFIKTVETYPRGWLVVDYYFYNVMTDPKARQYATENLEYHFMASADGSVQVFSWDHNKPQRKSPLFVELGKPLGGQASPPIDFTLSTAGPEADMLFYLEIEGVDSDMEAFMVLNGSAQVAIPKPQGKGYGKELAKVRVNKAMLKDGANQVQFSYNPAARELDYRPGFVIYNLTIGN